MDEAEIRDAIQRKLSDNIKKMVASSLSCASNVSALSASEGLTLDKLKAAMSEFKKIERNMRRTSVTVQVSAGHVGPMIKHEHPTDGTTVEASWLDAQRMHEVIPLVLMEVVDTEMARFRPAHQLDGWVPKTLPAPPYDLPRLRRECENG